MCTSTQEKCATTLDEQIQQLEERGMCFAHKDKAREILGDIGYYRLGFYWFPFEQSFPKKHNRTHRFKPGTSFETAVQLYYFDHDFRNIVAPSLYRIEVNFRTFVIYTVSNRFRNNPTWFADPQVVSMSFVANFPTLYNTIKKHEVIKEHHRKYRNDIYAPAWKTLEYMTLGNMIALYDALRSTELKEEIAAHYGLRNLKVFNSYLQTIRIVRNLCAHASKTYDIQLPLSIKPGPISALNGSNIRQNIVGCLYVIAYFLHSISIHREQDLRQSIATLLNAPHNQNIKSIIDFIRKFK